MNASISAKAASIAPEISPHRLLKVAGVTPFTTIDYPGKLAAVVFIHGCPWHCAYCHNTHLQKRPKESAHTWSEVLELLRRRVGLIDAVVFSGGEATIDPALHAAMLDVHELGFGVGLHTAGSYPQRLAKVLPLADWVGLDIKAPFDDYAHITGIPDSGQSALASAEAILASGVDYEFRTTIHPSLLSEDAIWKTAQALAGMGVQHYALQIFRPQGCRDEQLNAVATTGYPAPELVQRVAALFPHFTLRPA